MSLRALHLLTLLALVLSCAAWGQQPPEISDPTYFDRQYMQEQRTLISELAQREFGSGFNGNRQHDLDQLQRLLDRRLVKPGQTRELQAMGLIMGDLLASELDLDWVIYEDSVGRSRALRYRESDNYLFPMTMIARRQEADNQRPVIEIYQKAYDEMAAALPPKPFQ